MAEQMTLDFETARTNSDVIDELCKILKRPQSELLTAVRELQQELEYLRSLLRDLRSKSCGCDNEAISGTCCGCGENVDPERGQRRSFPG